MTTVRLFAALREAAGSAEVEVAADTAADLIAELADRFGPLMARRLETASVLVDGERLARDDTRVSLAAADEVVVVPPFAGG